jgi:RNA polymerase sigma-70 factor (ECF subfamily)
MEDPELLSGFKRGEPRTLERLYRIHRPAVVRSIRGAIRRRSPDFLQNGGTEIDDLVQEVFIRAFSPAVRSSYDGGRALAPLLVTIGRNLVKDGIRSRRREIRRLRSLDPQEAHQLTTSHRPSEPADVFALRRLAQMLRALPERERALIQVRFADGTSQRAAASALGASYQEVRTLELRLRRELRSVSDLPRPQ